MRRQGLLSRGLLLGSLRRFESFLLFADLIVQRLGETVRLIEVLRLLLAAPKRGLDPRDHRPRHIAIVAGKGVDELGVGERRSQLTDALGFRRVATVREFFEGLRPFPTHAQRDRSLSRRPGAGLQPLRRLIHDQPMVGEGGMVPHDELEPEGVVLHLRRRRLAARVVLEQFAVDRLGDVQLLAGVFPRLVEEFGTFGRSRRLLFEALRHPQSCIKPASLAAIIGMDLFVVLRRGSQQWNPLGITDFVRLRLAVGAFGKPHPRLNQRVERRVAGFAFLRLVGVDEGAERLPLLLVALPGLLEDRARLGDRLAGFVAEILGLAFVAGRISLQDRDAGLSEQDLAALGLGPRDERMIGPGGDELFEGGRRFVKPLRLRRRIDSAARHADQRDGALVIEHVFDVLRHLRIGGKLVEVVQGYVIVTTSAQPFEKRQIRRLGERGRRGERASEHPECDQKAPDAARAEAVPETSHINDILGRDPGGRWGDHNAIAGGSGDKDRVHAGGDGRPFARSRANGLTSSCVVPWRLATGEPGGSGTRFWEIRDADPRPHDPLYRRCLSPPRQAA